MRAARRTDAKFIRNERIPDEAYRLDRDPDETENLAGSEARRASGSRSTESRDATPDDDDAAIGAVESALTVFESEIDGEWDDLDDEDVLEDMGDEAKDRLQDLGYLE
jgi:hypothetical protein